MPATQPSPIGGLLRYWRSSRKMSQLELALAADVSSRHISFVETGRARPSREMILLLARVLDVPLREQNVLLEAAGFAAVYQERTLDAGEMKPVRKALDFILAHHEPYGCIVVDRQWNVVMQNQAVTRQMLYFLGPERILSGQPINAMRAVFEPDGLRPYIVNWDEVASALINRLHREALVDDPRSSSHTLLDEILALYGKPAAARPGSEPHSPATDRSSPPVGSSFAMPDLSREIAPIVPLELRKGSLELRMFSTIATLGTPQDVTAQELRIESFFPADEATDRLLHELAAQRD